jgi:GMP synthase (glutamine-hydrolysing)
VSVCDGVIEDKLRYQAMTHPWVILQHVAWEGPGLIVSEAEARGLHTEIRRLDLEASLPTQGDVEGLVVMGGPMGAYEAHKYRFLDAECSLIQDLVASDRPVLGVCLGAQLLARALGARVFPGHIAEIGFGTVQLSLAGNNDPILGPAGSVLPVFHWHGDTFDLPQGATLLASSVDYPHQAFRFGKCAYGLQFHVEPDSGIWSAWREHLPTALLGGSEERRRAIEQVGRGLIARFFALASASSNQSRNDATTVGGSQKQAP